MKKLDLLTNASILFVICAATAIAASAQTYTRLLSFDSTHGARPYAGLVQGTDGNFYGTTFYGGANGYGTIFRMSQGGALTTLYSFCSRAGCTDGGYPKQGRLIQAADGNFYGTTYWGGVYYRGTIFKITPGGTLTTLHSFDVNEGANPEAGLVQATDGNFYGTTFYGGANGYGTIFKMSADGTLTTLHSFNSTDGANPMAALIQSADGNLYGTTSSGGAYRYPNHCPSGYGCGTVFRISLGNILTTIYDFCAEWNCTDGAYPYTGLVQGRGGVLYGTTSQGGWSDVCSPAGCGTLFRITSDGDLITLHSFCLLRGCPDGSPYGEPLIQAADGNLYGTTSYGGANAYGTIFKMTVDPDLYTPPVLSTLYSFNSTDGRDDFAGLIQATDGTFYGTTQYGGADGYGTIFRFAMAPLLTSSVNPSIYGQKVTFTARVPTSGPVPPTGTVAFMWKYFTTTYTFGTATLNSAGVATLTKSNLNAGQYPMIVVYRGDTNNIRSTSPVLNQTVLQTTSAAALTSSGNPSTVGQAITFTAKFTSPTVIPSGPVTFKAGTTVLGTAQLSGGKATLTISTLPPGLTVVKVFYNGNSNIKGSSASIMQTVQR